MAIARALWKQRPFEGKEKLAGKKVWWRIKGKNVSKAKCELYDLKQANILFTHNQSSVGTAGS
jgi:hypothetical protein